jgi:hypothetical protein
MKQVIEIPEYLRSRGVVLDWDDGFEITVNVDPEGTVVISANVAGLLSLGRHCFTLAQSEVPHGSHVHLEPPDTLDDGSASLVLERR